MKTILCLSLSLWLLACTDMGELTVYKYTVRNESGVGIKLRGYKTNMNTNPTIIQLGNNQELSKTFKDGIPPRGPYGFSDFFDSDSLVVVFDSKKYLVYLWESRCENGNERNPLNTCFHSNNEEETFTFTVEDYENAEDCTGNCE